MVSLMAYFITFDLTNAKVPKMQLNCRRLTPLKCARKGIYFHAHENDQWRVKKIVESKRALATSTAARMWYHQIERPQNMANIISLTRNHREQRYKVWIKIRFKLPRFKFNGQQFEIVLDSFVELKIETSKLITRNRLHKSLPIWTSHKYCPENILVLFSPRNKFHFYGYWYELFVIYWFDILGYKFSPNSRWRPKSCEGN